MARLYEDFIDGTLTADPGASGTTINSAVLASLPVVASPDTMLITLDPDQAGGAPEIVQVTAHTASATSATVVRGQEGTTNRAHDIGTRITGSVYASDIETLQVKKHWIPVQFLGDQTVITTGDGIIGRWYMPFDGTFTEIFLRAGTGPTGADLQYDLNLNGTTLWGVTQANRPIIADGATTETVTTFDTTTFSDGDYLEWHCDQVGSTVAGADVRGWILVEEA